MQLRNFMYSYIYFDMQLTGSIVCICIYPYNITDIFPLLCSLFIVSLCIPKGSLQYFPTVVHKNLNTINQVALVSKQSKNYALRLRLFYHRSQALHMYLECSYPKLNHDNVIEALMMAKIA